MLYFSSRQYKIVSDMDGSTGGRFQIKIAIVSFMHNRIYWYMTMVQPLPHNRRTAETFGSKNATARVLNLFIYTTTRETINLLYV